LPSSLALPLHGPLVPQWLILPVSLSFPFRSIGPGAHGGPVPSTPGPGSGSALSRCTILCVRTLFWPFCASSFCCHGTCSVSNPEGAYCRCLAHLGVLSVTPHFCCPALAWPTCAAMPFCCMGLAPSVTQWGLTAAASPTSDSVSFECSLAFAWPSGAAMFLCFMGPARLVTHLEYTAAAWPTNGSVPLRLQYLLEPAWHVTWNEFTATARLMPGLQ